MFQHQHRISDGCYLIKIVQECFHPRKLTWDELDQFVNPYKALFSLHEGPKLEGKSVDNKFVHNIYDSKNVNFSKLEETNTDNRSVLSDEPNLNVVNDESDLNIASNVLDLNVASDVPDLNDLTQFPNLPNSLNNDIKNENDIINKKKRSV